MTIDSYTDAAMRRSVRMLITVADNVRRGVLPHRALHKLVPPDVAAPIVAELPAGTGTSLVRNVHLQQDRPNLINFTGSAIRPDNSAIAYLGLIARPDEASRWRISQVLPVTERTLGAAALRRAESVREDITQRMRDLIADGYIDHAIQLLGPIPPYKAEQRHDWLDAATAVREHGRATGLGAAVVADLAADREEHLGTRLVARQLVDAYTRTYGVEVDRYATAEVRLDSLTGEHDVQRDTGRGIER